VCENRTKKQKVAKSLTGFSVSFLISGCGRVSLSRLSSPRWNRKKRFFFSFFDDEKNLIIFFFLLSRVSLARNASSPRTLRAAAASITHTAV